MADDELEPGGAYRHAECDARPAWGVPFWLDGGAYPSPLQGLDQWRWEFVRRRPDYRAAWSLEHERQARIFRFAVLRNQLKATKEFRGFYDRAYVVEQMQGFCREPFWFDKALKLWICNPHRRAAQPIFYASKSLLNSGKNQSDDIKHITMYFYLSESIQNQVREADRILSFYQRQEGLGSVSQRRVHRDKWPLYLRALDARDAGASWSRIAAVLLPGKSPQAARGLWQQAERLMFKVGA